MQAVAKAVLLGASYNVRKIETKTGKSMCAFNLRVWIGKTGKDKVMFLPIVAYAGAADVLLNHLKDGKLVYLDCQIDQYKDKENRERTQYIVQEFSFLGDNKEVINELG
jgi:single-stranded DNA-binding protein